MSSGNLFDLFDLSLTSPRDKHVFVGCSWLYVFDVVKYGYVIAASIRCHILKSSRRTAGMCIPGTTRVVYKYHSAFRRPTWNSTEGRIEDHDKQLEEIGNGRKTEVHSGFQTNSNFSFCLNNFCRLTLKP